MDTPAHHPSGLYVNSLGMRFVQVDEEGMRFPSLQYRNNVKTTTISQGQPTSLVVHFQIALQPSVLTV